MSDPRSEHTTAAPAEGADEFRAELDRGVPCWGYATWWVRQAMQQLVAELTRPVVLSDRALRHLARMKQAHHEAIQRSGHAPTRDELARRTGLSAEHRGR